MFTSLLSRNYEELLYPIYREQSSKSTIAIVQRTFVNDVSNKKRKLFMFIWYAFILLEIFFHLANIY